MMGMLGGYVRGGFKSSVTLLNGMNEKNIRKDDITNIERVKHVKASLFSLIFYVAWNVSL